MCFGNVYTLNQRFRWWICCLCQQELDSHGGTVYYVNCMVVARRIRLININTYKRPTESDSWLVVWEHTKPYVQIRHERHLQNCAAILYKVSCERRIETATTIYMVNRTTLDSVANHAIHEHMLRQFIVDHRSVLG